MSDKIRSVLSPKYGDEWERIFMGGKDREQPATVRPMKPDRMRVLLTRYPSAHIDMIYYGRELMRELAIKRLRPIKWPDGRIFVSGMTEDGRPKDEIWAYAKADNVEHPDNGDYTSWPIFDFFAGVGLRPRERFSYEEIEWAKKAIGDERPAQIDAGEYEDWR